MAQFRTHFILGVISGGAAAAACVMQSILSPVRGFLAAFIYALASVLPDLDSSTGKAKTFLFETLAVILPALWLSQSRYSTAEQGFIIIVFLYFCVKYPCEYLFDRFTKHRGIFHSLPMTVVMASGTALIFHASPPPVRYLYAGACAGGYLFHLILDEACSFFGAKKSLGTALKLHSSSIPATLLAYLAAAVLTLLAFFPGLLPLPF